jgi:hypothetical protein
MASAAAALVSAILGVTWELPQTALGAAVLAGQLARRSVRAVTPERGCVCVEVDTGAVSLGRFVFHSAADNPYVPVGRENKDHELGHAVQSRRLGPLYLAVVGVPSSLRVAYAMGYRYVRGRRWGGYYEGFPEKQADALGGVDRALRPAP